MSGWEPCATIVVRRHERMALPCGGRSCHNIYSSAPYLASAIWHIVNSQDSGTRESTTKKWSRRPDSRGLTAIVYHLRPPTRVKHVEPAAPLHRNVAEPALTAPSPRQTGGVAAVWRPGHRPRASPGNEDVTIARCRPSGSRELYPQCRRRRSASSSTRGRESFTRCSVCCPFSDFDYIVIPRCTTYRIEFDEDWPGRLAGDRVDGRRLRFRAVI